VRKEKLFGLALAVALGVTGCVDRQAQKDAAATGAVLADPAKSVVVSVPKVEDIEDVININGEVVTSDESAISAVGSGKLAAVYVNDGDSVSAGQVIALLDSENLQQATAQARASLASATSQLSQAKANARLAPDRSTAAVRQAEAALKSAKAQLSKALKGARPEEQEQAQNNLRAAKSNLETAKKNLERVRTLVKEGALAESQLDTAKNGYESALAQYENALAASSISKSAIRPEDIETARESVRQAEQGVASAKASKSLDVTLMDQVRTAEAQVQSARAQVAVAEKNLREASIRAPYSGRIYGKPVQAGTVVAPGTPIARIVGGQGIYFEGQVPSDKIGRVTPGTSVYIRTDAGSESYNGKVISVSPQGDSVGRLFNARVIFTNGSGAVRPGMFAKGSVVLNRIAGATVVPDSAVLTKDGKRYVVVAEGSKAKRVFVTVGIRLGDQVQIEGLPSSAQLITKGQEGLVDGSLIKVVK
jgi:RND family efflux transporter MFP subunit